ncbi:hypothetical protein [Hyphomicrobium sp. NDB2Meth4]|uniref:hypothetical protein n=1 Tax=Hyphomicrobium sp. NDB2Meth4 TaxID=1892846 RepID=UPI000930DCBE|nr:hypothetical protein [Hyphomicrobium sp. NDB2Meth4]
MHSTSTALCAAFALSIAMMSATEAKPLRLISTNAQALSAKDAGIRYGEAAGAVLVCQSLRITPRVAELRGRYQGADLEEFDAQAGKILKAWQESLSCQHANAPVDCMISQRWSCQQALREIGPSGTAVRGLVEPKE